jgi:hypothetical protein
VIDEIEQENYRPGEWKNDPVDDFARGPEVKFGHENERWKIRKESEPLPVFFARREDGSPEAIYRTALGDTVIPDEILSVLKPFAEPMTSISSSEASCEHQ